MHFRIHFSFSGARGKLIILLIIPALIFSLLCIILDVRLAARILIDYTLPYEGIIVSKGDLSKQWIWWLSDPEPGQNGYFIIETPEGRRVRKFVRWNEFWSLENGDRIAKKFGFGGPKIVGGREE